MPLRGKRPIGASQFGARRILCVASLKPRKNHLTLLAASELLWREGRRFTLVLVGRSIREVSDVVLQRILGLQQAGWPVLWQQHVDDGALREEYEACSFTVFPPLREGFGLPIFGESMVWASMCLWK
jgi:glycosyltransferase involved in cell wall biosynthesis